MNTFFRVPAAIVLATVILAPLTGQATTRPSVQRGSADYVTFKKLIDGYYAAWSSLKPDNAGVYYAKDANLVFFDIAPLKYNGWAEYKKGVMTAFIDQVTTGKLTPKDDLKVTRRGTVVWTTLTFHLSAQLKAGGPMELDGRHTAIWEKRGANWLIVHEHVSAPLPG